MPKTDNKPLYRWAFTYYPVNHDVELEPFIAFLKSVAKKYVFQLEECPTTGRLHYQGRVSLRVRTRKNAIAHPTSNGLPKGWRLSEEVTDNEISSSFYCTDVTKRKAGPWSDKDRALIVPAQWRLTTLLPWQDEMIERLRTQNARKVLFVLDNGRTGKGAIRKHLMSLGRAHSLPSSLESAKEVNQWVCGIYKNIDETKRCEQRLCLMLDVPRATPTEKFWRPYIACLECFKDGSAQDGRYANNEVHFISPRIVVFCNELPPATLLSGDRWETLLPPPLAPGIVVNDDLPDDDWGATAPSPSGSATASVPSSQQSDSEDVEVYSEDESEGEFTDGDLADWGLE